MMKFAGLWEDHGFVFTTEMGSPVNRLLEGFEFDLLHVTTLVHDLSPVACDPKARSLTESATLRITHLQHAHERQSKR